MKRKITYIIVIIIALMIILPIKSFGTTATITTEGLNLRKEASTESNIIEVLNKNDKVELISEDGEWCKVKHNSNEGYVKKEYIEINEQTNNDTINNAEQQVDEKPETPITKSIEVKDNMVIVNLDTQIKIIPTINSNVIGEVNAGSQLEIITKINHWIFVQNDEISGWICFNDAEQTIYPNKQKENEEENEPQEETQEQFNEEYEQTTKYVKSSSIYIRKGPSTDTEIIASLIKNTDVTVIGEENGWYKVKYEDSIGYIREDLLSDTKITETSRDGETVNRNTNEVLSSVSNQNYNGTGSDIVNYAYNYLGCPYVYGGSGPSSFDCSGFTAYVYSHFGYSLPHSAVAQMNYGVEVSMDELQPGDLVFFLDYPTMNGVGHCGIYIGNGEFIHASSGSGYCVKTSTLLTGSYRTRYYTARRLV